MSISLVSHFVNKAAIVDNGKLEIKATELLRLLRQKLPDMFQKNVGSHWTVIAIDLSCQALNILVSRDTLISLTLIKKSEYQRLLTLCANTLNIAARNEISLESLSIQFGSDIGDKAKDLISLYTLKSAQFPVLARNINQNISVDLICAAFLSAAKELKIKVNENEILERSGIKRSQYNAAKTHLHKIIGNDLEEALKPDPRKETKNFGKINITNKRVALLKHCNSRAIRNPTLPAVKQTKDSQKRPFCELTVDALKTSNSVCLQENKKIRVSFPIENLVEDKENNGFTQNIINRIPKVESKLVTELKINNSIASNEKEKEEKSNGRVLYEAWLKNKKLTEKVN